MCPDDPIFYVYIYLDTRKPGRYKYDNIDCTFLYEPFYVGKGGTSYQWMSHLKHIKSGRFDEHNPVKSYKIQHILELDMEPKIIKIRIEMDERCSFDLESFYIINIGRMDLNMGPLANLTFGGEGTCGYKWTKEQRQKHSNIQKRITNIPEIKEKRANAAKISHSKEKYLRKARAIGKKLQSDPVRRQNNINSNKRKWKDPKFRKWRSDLQKKILGTVEARKHNSIAQKKAQNRPDVKEKKRLCAYNQARRKAGMLPVRCLEDIPCNEKLKTIRMKLIVFNRIRIKQGLMKLSSPEFIRDFPEIAYKEEYYVDKTLRNLDS